MYSRTFSEAPRGGGGRIPSTTCLRSTVCPCPCLEKLAEASGLCFCARPSTRRGGDCAGASGRCRERVMRRQTITLLVLILSAAATAWMFLPRSPLTIEPTASASVPQSFVVFDATLYKDKPSLESYHVRPITVLYEAQLFVANQLPAAMPPETIVRSVAHDLRGSSEPVVLDIERWPLKGDGLAVQSPVEYFVSVLDWVNGEAPGLLFGIYVTVPVQDYWRAIRDPASAEFQSWQQDNDRLEGIFFLIDALSP